MKQTAYKILLYLTIILLVLLTFFKLFLPGLTTTTTTTLGPMEPVSGEQVLDDITRIDQYFKEYNISGCLKITELRTKNPGLNPTLADGCYYNAAILNLNESYCNPIIDSSAKELCLTAVESKAKKTLEQKKTELDSICSRIKAQQEYEIQNWGKTFNHSEYEPYYSQCNLNKNGAN